MVAGCIILAALATLLLARLRRDNAALARLPGGAQPSIFHSFLARDADGQIIAAAPRASCTASAFASLAGPGQRQGAGDWERAIAAAGGGIGACSYILCPRCGPDPVHGGPRVLAAAAYEPALVFWRLRAERRVLVEDGRWQRSLLLPLGGTPGRDVSEIRSAIARLDREGAETHSPTRELR